MDFLRNSNNPEAVLEALSTLEQPPIRRMHRPGFGDFLNRMPVIDPTRKDQQSLVDMTRTLMTEMIDEIKTQWDKLDIPHIPENGFGRIILAIEDPKEGRNGELVPGTEIVLALWGKGFASHVHGHAPGYINEALVDGAFDVHLYDTWGDPDKRFAMYQRTIEQRDTGVFYAEFVRDTGQKSRSAVIHNFVAKKPSFSLHYLPEHVRDGNANRFTPIMGTVNDFYLDSSDVDPIDFEQAMDLQKGDVILVRSTNVKDLGDHFSLITGGLVDKPHGKRPEDAVYLLGENNQTPLSDRGDDELLILKLSDEARLKFYEYCNVESRHCTA